MAESRSNNVSEGPVADAFQLDPTLAAKLQRKFAHKQKLSPPRKNLYYVVQILNSFIGLGAETITSIELQEAVDELGWREKWDLNPDPVHVNGLRKELAGLIGGFGLRLSRIRSREGNIYRLPKDKVGDEYLKGVGIRPDLVHAQAIDQRLVLAIRNRHPITFRYRDDPPTHNAPRLINPHFYGNQSGAVNVEGYQTGGYSSSGNVPSWRVFRLDDMREIKVLLGFSFSPWPGYRTDHTKYQFPYEMIQCDR